VELPFVPRLRARISRPVARWLIETAWTRRAAAKSRLAPVDGRTLDEQLAAMLGFDDLDNHSDLRGLSPRAARIRVAEGIVVAQAPFAGDVAVEALELAGAGGVIAARRYVPTGLAAPSPAVLYIHGGGFVTGDLDTHDPLCRLIAVNARARVVSIDYRLAPEYPFPAAADDAVAAFRDVAERADGLGIDRSRIAVAGDSAGGHLSALVSLETRSDRFRPALQVPCYPALDATCSLPSHATFAERYFLTAPMIGWYYDAYFGADPEVRRTPRASPLLAGDFSGLPRALVYVSGFDPLRDEGLAYAERLREANVPVRAHCFDDLLHGFLLMTAVSRAALAATLRVATDVGEALRTP
jgi:acetyl esterase